MSNDNDYLKEFVEAQENQYTQWKYLSRGEPTPFLKAKGKALPLAILLLSQSVFFLFMAIYTYTIDPLWKGLVMLIPSAFFLITGLGYVRLHRERKKASRASRQANRGKRKKRDK